MQNIDFEKRGSCDMPYSGMVLLLLSILTAVKRVK